jgi:alpha-galactosidase
MKPFCILIGVLALSVSASADAIERPTAAFRETVPGLRIETQAYPDHAATEWQFRLRAPEAGESPLYENLKSADFEVGFAPDAKVRLHWSKGSHSEPGDFEPKTNALVVGEVFSLESFGGRSSDGVMPYFNLASESGGLIVAIGWTGDWKASFELQKNGSLRVTAGRLVRTGAPGSVGDSTCSGLHCLRPTAAPRDGTQG